MKYLIICLLSLGANILSAQTIPPQEAKQHEGKKQTVCGLVTDSHAGSKATFLNMGGKYPNQQFTIVIYAENVSKFNYELTSLQGKNVCVTGLIKHYKGKPQIVQNTTLQMKTEQFINYYLSLYRKKIFYLKIFVYSF